MTDPKDFNDLLDSIRDDEGADSPHDEEDPPSDEQIRSLWNQVNQAAEAETWRPVEAGDGIVGTVTQTGTVQSKFKPQPVPTITLRTHDGSLVRVVAYATVLDREIRDRDIEVGDLVAIKYLGEKTLKTDDAGGTYKGYAVAVRKNRT